MKTDLRQKARMASIPRPAAPIAEAWQLSISGLIRQLPLVPSIAARLLRRLDRYGQVILTPDRVGFDDKSIPWNKIIELRLHPIAGVPPTVVVDREVDRIRELLPPVPGRKHAVAAAAEALLTLFLAGTQTAVQTERQPRNLPCEIVYRTRLGRRASLPAGIFAVGVLAAIPEVADSMTATAQARKIPIQAIADPRGDRRAERAEQLRQNSTRLGAGLRAARAYRASRAERRAASAAS
jgi:hypothetical protein